MKTDSKIYIQAEVREKTGKRTNKKLRRQGKIPANIFGKDFKSQSIAVDHSEFNKVYKQAGRTSVVYIKLGKKELPVLINHIDYHPVTTDFLHIDFKKVDLKQKVTAEVNVKVVGESPAVKEGAELILQSPTVEVEALPDEMPSEISVDISNITESGVEIKVSDLPKSDKYEILDDPDKVLVVIAKHTVEEVETPSAGSDQEETAQEKDEKAEEPAAAKAGETKDSQKDSKAEK
ncbi:MAG: 50S ribosomal protein L25 [Patescibacteria group bacterium]|nr:MAG: 50S ribosomal protein L25 [Patescibacteria group bacterium]